jgi:hypothetical protein
MKPILKKIYGILTACQGVKTGALFIVWASPGRFWKPGKLFERQRVLARLEKMPR